MPKIRVNLLRKRPRTLLNENWVLLALFAFVALLVIGLEGAQANVVETLRGIKHKSDVALTKIDRDLVNAYSETVKISRKDVLSNTADQTINFAVEKIETLMAKKREELAKSELMDKLTYKIENSERNINLRERLPQIIDQLVIGEMAFDCRDEKKATNMLPFLINLAVSLRTLPEPIENPINFLETYIQFSSITSPRPVSEFYSSQGYLNDTTLKADSEATKSTEQE